MGVLLVEWMALTDRWGSMIATRERTAPDARVRRYEPSPWVVSVLLAIPVFALYGTFLEHSPVYLAHDEVAFALNAHAIATTARDVNGHRLPLYFHIGGNFWATPMNIYFTALFVKMFGVSESVIRTPSAVIGTLNVVLMYFIGRRIFGGEPLAIIASVLLALTPAHFIHSRLGADHIYALPFMLAWLLYLLRFWQEERFGMLFAATTFLGFGVYTYIGSVVMMPVFFAITCVMLFVKYRTSLRPYVVAAAGFAWPLLPLVPWHLTHPTQYADQIRMYSLYDARKLNPLQGLKEVLSHTGLTARTDVYYNYFNPSFLFFSGDSSLINATRQAGVFLLPLAVFIPAGMYHIFTRAKTPLTRMLVAGLACAPIAAVLPAEVKINRALVMVPFAILIAAFGVRQVFAQRNPLFRLAGAILLVAVPLQFRSFYRDYTGDYRLRSSYWFENNIRGGLEEIMRRNRPDAIRPVYLSTDIQWVEWYWPLYLIKERREDLRARTMYFDPKTIDVNAMQPGSLVLSRADAASERPFTDRGPLRNVTPIREPNDGVYFVVFER